jgi:hypothetical protein
MKRIEYTNGDIIGEAIFNCELPRLIQPSGQPKRMGRFTCKCGESFDATIDNVRRLHTVSCGCVQKIATSRARTTHGMSRDAIYNRWCSMKQRCNDTNSGSYAMYGGRGIKVCDEWNNSFEKFYEWSIESGFRDSLEIDRIDNYTGYEPSNCRWVTCSENRQNIRHKTGGSSKFIGVSKTRNGKFIAKISDKKVEHYIGTFVSEEDAAIAVNLKIDELGTKHTKNKV